MFVRLLTRPGAQGARTITQKKGQRIAFDATRLGQGRLFGKMQPDFPGILGDVLLQMAGNIQSQHENGNALPGTAGGTIVRDESRLTEPRHKVGGATGRGTSMAPAADGRQLSGRSHSGNASSHTDGAVGGGEWPSRGGGC
jgi:hypothetical protein